MSAPVLPEHDTITVHLENRTHDILVGCGWLAHFGEVLAARIRERNVMVFTSPTIGALYYAPLENSLLAAGFQKIRRHDIPDGEPNKNLAEYANCCEALVSHFPQTETPPVVVNLGGGVVGDMGGFVAATFLRRGVPYIQAPTTLLGCVDCGVGGKTGVNTSTVKNIIGRFYQPRLVFADLALLSTLPAREIRSGVAEVIKYGAVCDAALFEYLEANIEALLSLDPPVLTHVVAECYRIKARVVESDEEDNKGLRNVLNYGHTVGHALEMANDFKMTHGEAICVGMAAVNGIALRLGILDPESDARIRALILRAGLPVTAPAAEVSFERLLESMKHDKKFREGSNLFVLPTMVGAWQPARDVPMQVIAEAVGSCLV